MATNTIETSQVKSFLLVLSGFVSKGRILFMLFHTNVRAIFGSAECQVIAVSTKEYFWIYPSATQISTTIINLNSTLSFTDINVAYVQVTTEMNGNFPGICFGSRICASRIWPTSPKYLLEYHKQ